MVFSYCSLSSTTIHVLIFAASKDTPGMNITVSQTQLLSFARYDLISFLLLLPI